MDGLVLPLNCHCGWRVGPWWTRPQAVDTCRPPAGLRLHVGRRRPALPSGVGGPRQCALPCRCPLGDLCGQRRGGGRFPFRTHLSAGCCLCWLRRHQTVRPAAGAAGLPLGDPASRTPTALRCVPRVLATGRTRDRRPEPGFRPNSLCGEEPSEEPGGVASYHSRRQGATHRRRRGRLAQRSRMKADRCTCAFRAVRFLQRCPRRRGGRGGEGGRPERRVE